MRLALDVRSMTDWLETGLDDDMRPHMFGALDAGQTFALATIIAADGGPRPVGAQMVVTADHSWGYLSGGCIEPDVVLHARQVMADGTPRTLVYGRGSPFIDMRLPCGGRVELLVERVQPDDGALADLRQLTNTRRLARWESDGRFRRCIPHDPAQVGRSEFARLYAPYQRLAVVGTDPFALAIARLGRIVGWQTSLHAPSGPAPSPAFDMPYRPETVPLPLTDMVPDRWTAIAVATHEIDADERVLVQALRSDAGYVGLLGSRRRVPELLERLRRSGLDDDEIGRLRAPIGLPIAAKSPWEVAVAVAAEIIASYRKADACRPLLIEAAVHETTVA
ncbi:XdhC family protein [Sphingopyxis panaciterrae]|uniref:XdhC family protein n=1 Tax=Sphingopyxis panaciterrae TaxID=363841 RepID=UPI001423E35B|nr:XdhC family protein [Sphingopyxis panaciterrae]